MCLLYSVTRLQRHFLESGLELLWTAGKAGSASPASGGRFLTTHLFWVIIWPFPGLMWWCWCLFQLWPVHSEWCSLLGIQAPFCLSPDLTAADCCTKFLAGYCWDCPYVGGNRNCLLLSSSHRNNNQFPPMFIPVQWLLPALWGCPEQTKVRLVLST